MKRAALPILLALVAAAPALAAPPADSVQALARRQPTAGALRATLRGEVERLADSDAVLAGEAAGLVGASYARAGLADSAAIYLRRAWELRGTLADALALVDLLYARQSPDDVREAARLLAAAQRSGGEAGPSEQEGLRARLAWSELLAGNPGAARDAFATLSPGWSHDPLWRTRMARAWLEAGDRKRALQLVLPAVVAARGQEADGFRLLQRTTGMTEDRVLESLGQELAKRDRSEAALFEKSQGHRVRFAARDGFPLAGFVFEPTSRGKRPSVVWLRGPGDSLASCDSLAGALRAAGYATILVDPRGTGWSVAPPCPLPQAWAGREDEMEALTAADVRSALRALASSARSDTSSFTLVATGPLVGAALRAAEQDARIRALVLLSPVAPPATWGTIRGAVARLQMPIFWSQAPEDFGWFDVYDEFYQAGDRRASRVADVKGGRSGAWPYRSDATAAPRLIRWLAEPKAPRAAPAARRR